MFSIYDLCSSFEWKLSANKSFSFDFLVVKDWTEYFEFRLKCTRRIDHAGLGLSLSLFGFELLVGVHDNRHWNDDDNRWYVFGESDYIENLELEND